MVLDSWVNRMHASAYLSLAWCKRKSLIRCSKRNQDGDMSRVGRVENSPRDSLLCPDQAGPGQVDSAHCFSDSRSRWKFPPWPRWHPWWSQCDDYITPFLMRDNINFPDASRAHSENCFFSGNREFTIPSSPFSGEWVSRSCNGVNNS